MKGRHLRRRFSLQPSFMKDDNAEDKQKKEKWVCPIINLVRINFIRSPLPPPPPQPSDDKVALTCVARIPPANHPFEARFAGPTTYLLGPDMCLSWLPTQLKYCRYGSPKYQTNVCHNLSSFVVHPTHHQPTKLKLNPIYAAVVVVVLGWWLAGRWLPLSGRHGGLAFGGLIQLSQP